MIRGNEGSVNQSSCIVLCLPVCGVDVDGSKYACIVSEEERPELEAALEVRDQHFSAYSVICFYALTVIGEMFTLLVISNALFISSKFVFLLLLFLLLVLF